MIPYENPPLRIDLGTLLSDPDIRVVLTEQELGEHVAVLGQIGSGKSRLLQAIIRQIILQRGGLAVLDPAGDLVEDTQLWIDENSEKIGPFVRENLTVFEANECHAFAIDPLCYRRGTPGDANHHAFLLTKADWISFGILRTVGQMGYNDTRRLARFLPAAVYACGVPLDDHGHHIPLSEIGGFVDPFHAEYGRLYERVERLLPPDVRTVFDLMHSFDDRHDVLDFTESTINLEQTFFKGVTGAIFSGQAEPFDFQQVIRRGGVLLVNLRHNDYGLSEHQASALGFFLQSELASAAELMPRDQRTAFTVVADECPRFVDAKLGDTLRNSRKWGLSYVLAAQDITSLSYGGTDLKEIVWGVPNTKIAFQQILGDDLDFLAPTFLYGNLKTTPLLHEEQRLAGHALLPIVEQTQRHERSASDHAESSVVNSQATTDRKQQEHEISDAQVQTKRAEEIRAKHKRQTEAERHAAGKVSSQEQSREQASSQAQRSEELARKHAGLTTTEEHSAATLRRNEERWIHATAQDQINTKIDAQELAKEHATARTHEELRADKLQHKTEDRSEESVAKTSGQRSTDAEQTKIDEVYTTPYIGNAPRSLTTRRTYDRQRERTELFGITETKKQAEARIKIASEEQATKDAKKTSDTKIARDRHSDEQQERITASDQKTVARVAQQDHVNRMAVAKVQGVDLQATQADETERSQAERNTHRKVISDSQEKVTTSDTGTTAEHREVVLNELSKTAVNKTLSSVVAEQQRALAEKRAHATSDVTTDITAERHLLLPVNILIQRPTGQWEESEDQQKAKTKNGLAGQAKRECTVRFREQPAVEIRVIDVDDAYGELPPWLRMDILGEFTNFLVKKQPSCFIPDLTIQAEQRRLPDLFAALDQAQQIQRLPAPPPRRLFVLPPAALPAPGDSPFEI